MTSRAVSDENRRVWMGNLALLCSPAFPVNAGKVLVAMLPPSGHLMADNPLVLEACREQVAQRARQASYKIFPVINHNA
jgi:hypothetical protein